MEELFIVNSERTTITSSACKG